MARSSVIALCTLLLACGGGAPIAVPEQNTLESHARAQDDEGLKLATAALKSKSAEERMRGLAALLEYEPVKLAPLFEAIAERVTHAEGAGEKAAAAWALVRAGDVRVAAAALALHDSGELTHVKKLDGSAAFDAVVFAKLLAAATVSEDLARSRRMVMAGALAAADAKTRAVIVRALTEDSGDGAILAAAAEALDPSKDFAVLEYLFQRLHAVPDPRAAPALAHYADHATHPHFRTEAAFRLAELGDMRAAPHLAWRLGEDPTKIYDAGDPNVVPLRRDDRERVSCARMLAELALMHPEARVQLREMVEAPVTAWMHAHPQPHANALRLLVAVESPQAAPLLRTLADPHDAIPGSGAPSFPEAYASAQSALRYLGRSHDASAFATLAKQLARKPAAFDASLDALMQGGHAIEGMVYRALTAGAAQGFAELGDAKAIPLLVKLADDGRSSEAARIEACNAVGALAEGPARRDIVSKVRAFGVDRKRELERSCWLLGLSQRPNSRDDAALVSLLAPKLEPEARHQTARLLGQGGLAASERTRLIEMLKDKTLVHDAALALLFGGDEPSVAKVFAAYEASDTEGAAAPPPLEPLRQLYAQSVPTFTEDFYDSGALARIATLAVAARSVTFRGAKQEWVLQGLSYQLRQSGEFETGPHTTTRVRLRAKLIADAKTEDTKKRDDALLVLWVLGERAVLDSLGDKTHVNEPSP